MKVIPDGWSEHHRPVTEGAFQSSVELLNPGTGPGKTSDWTFDGGLTDGAPDVLWNGRARIQQLANQASLTDAADQLIVPNLYLVVIPKDAPQPTADVTRVKVTAVDSNGDPSLVGKVLTVLSVETGTHTWERDLTCILDQTNQTGDGQ